MKFCFFFNDTATTEIYTLSLHDALPICSRPPPRRSRRSQPRSTAKAASTGASWSCRSTTRAPTRSEEHTSELQSRQYLVCRLLLEKKKKSIQPLLLFLLFTLLSLKLPHR